MALLDCRTREAWSIEYHSNYVSVWYKEQISRLHRPRQPPASGSPPSFLFASPSSLASLNLVIGLKFERLLFHFLFPLLFSPSLPQWRLLPRAACWAASCSRCSPIRTFPGSVAVWSITMSSSGRLCSWSRMMLSYMEVCLGLRSAPQGWDLHIFYGNRTVFWTIVLGNVEHANMLCLLI
jgi:hypothetical protein